ncbi:MAG: tetratricopeptide repeat protein [Pseudomonadota bacterium]
MRRFRLTLPAICLISIACTIVCNPCMAETYLEYYEQGEFFLRVEKWDRAIELFSKTIEASPGFFLAYHNRAIAYSKKGDYEKSLQDLKKAVELNADYPDAYGLMGLVYEIKKDYKSAMEAYKQALAKEKRPDVKKRLQKWIQDMEVKTKPRS